MIMDRLKLTKEQKAIIEEYKNILQKMEEANILIVKQFDSPDAYALNGNDVEDLSFQEDEFINAKSELVSTNDCELLPLPQGLCLDWGEEQFRVEFKRDFYVWTDSDSKVEVPEELYEKDFKTEQEAINAAVDFVHKYDGQPYRVIAHVEDGRAYETVETVENMQENQ